MIRNLITKELSVFPSQEDGKYPEDIMGKVFKISGIDNMYYCQNDRILTWNFPDELYDAVELVVMENMNAPGAKPQASKLRPKAGLNPRISTIYLKAEVKNE